MHSKNDFIEDIKTWIAVIPFDTVEENSDTLFDRVDEDTLSTNIGFLKDTKLSEITYSDIDINTFKMTNSTTEAFITLSNRLSENGELRGEILRKLLDEQKIKYPDEFVYQTISRIIKNPKYSDLLASIWKSIQDSFIDRYHFNLFCELLVDKIQNKINNKTLREDLNLTDIRANKALRDTIWQDIDAISIYEQTTSKYQPLKPLIDNFKKIETKGNELLSLGYTNAGNIAKKLYGDLTEASKNLIEGKLSVEDFHNNCNKLIEEAQDSELKNHRGLFGRIWHGIEVALNAITFGAVAITPTKSIQTTIELKYSLLQFMNADKTAVEQDSLPASNTKSI